MTDTQQTKVEFYSQQKYDIWLATNPDFSRITKFRAENLPRVTALPDMPAVTEFRADSRLTKIRNAMAQV